MPDHPLRLGSETGTVDRDFLTPFEGASPGSGSLLGLKPQAESWNPFGARDQILLSLPAC
jgi:hypothetical protein